MHYRKPNTVEDNQKQSIAMSPIPLNGDRNNQFQTNETEQLILSHKTITRDHVLSNHSIETNSMKSNL